MPRQLKKMPAPWKRNIHPPGQYIRPLGIGHMTVDIKNECWWLFAPRGKLDFLDAWGPWKGSLAEEANIEAKMVAWLAALGTAGWFEMKLSWEPSAWHWRESDWDLIYRTAAKLPRCETVGKWLRHVDSRRAANGKAIAGNVLRIGGIDFHADAPRDHWDILPHSNVELSVQKPGLSRRTPGGIHMHLDEVSLDTLIAFLVDIRSKMVPKEIEQDFQKRASPEDKNLDVWGRFHETQNRSAKIVKLMESLRSSDMEDIDLLQKIINMPRVQKKLVGKLYEEGQPTDEAG